MRQGLGMDEQTIFERVVVSRDILHGKPRISGTRILVHQVLDLLAAGKTSVEIRSEDYYPDLQDEDILACIAFASQLIRDERIVPSA